MNPIIRNLGWHFNDTPINKLYTIQNNDNDPFIDEFGFKKLSIEQRDIIIHPSSDWLLYGNFDYRSLPNTFKLKRNNYIYNDEIKWIKHMSKLSTITDLYNAINKAYSYGYFEGLEFFDSNTNINIPFKFQNLPIYKILYGT